MSRSHILYLSFRVFRHKVESQKWKDPKILPLMQLLARVFAMKQVLLDNAACYETGFFSRGSSELLMNTMKKALKELRP